MLNRHEWNEKVAEFAPPFGAFLQSYEWGLFQEALGRPVRRVYEKSAAGTFLGLFIDISLAAGIQYTTSPKGPLGDVKENDLLSKLREVHNRAIFMRIEPAQDVSFTHADDVQPHSTILIDLHKSLEDIYAEMKPKTRYNVRLGERKGVEMRELHPVKEFDSFWLLMQQTAVRDHIRLHPVSYYRTLLKAMSQKNGAQAKLVGAYYDNRLLAANMIVDFAGTRTYLHGATSNLHRNVMAQYVLHAKLIEQAKIEGLNTFDFWGVVSEDEEEKGHSWAGISRYKRSFGGTFVEMPGTFDVVISPLKYELYRIVRRLRRII